MKKEKIELERKSGNNLKLVRQTQEFEKLKKEKQHLEEAFQVELIN